jgi:hypothetical protein
MSALTPRPAQYRDAEHADVWLKAQAALFISRFSVDLAASDSREEKPTRP